MKRASLSPATRWAMRALAALIIFALAGASAVGGYYAIENWSGWSEWRASEAGLVERGEMLALPGRADGAVPEDERNMAAAPVFRDLFLEFGALSDPGLLGVRLPPGGALRDEGDPAVVMLARRFRAEFRGTRGEASRVVMDGLEPMARVLQDVADAAARPDASWPLDFSQGVQVPTPFIDPLLKLAEVLGARGIARVEAGDGRGALNDCALLIELAQRANTPAILAGTVVQERMVVEATGIIEHAITLGAWSDAELAEAGEKLREFNPLDAFAASLRGERAIFLASSGQLLARAAPYFRIVDFSTRLSEVATRGMAVVAWNLRPSGWSHADRAIYVDVVQRYLENFLGDGFARPAISDALQRRMATVRRRNGEFFRTPLAALCLPPVGAVARRATHAKARLALARAACALDRFRMAEGRIPESLAELVPTYIDAVPRDPSGGSALVYRPTPGGYLLYSLGWNGVDDGGGAAAARSRTRELASAKDWVWMANAESTRR